DDWVIGFEGDDTLSGGEGSDLFFFAGGYGSDVILDMQGGIDTVLVERNINGLDVNTAGRRGIGRGRPWQCRHRLRQRRHIDPGRRVDRGPAGRPVEILFDRGISGDYASIRFATSSSITSVAPPPIAWMRASRAMRSMTLPRM